MKRIDKGTGRVELFEDGFHRGEGGAYRRTGFDSDSKDGMATFAHEDRRLHRVIRIIADDVFRYPDDGIGLSPMFDGFTDGVFKSEDAGTRFVNDGGRAVGEVLAGKITAFDNVPADSSAKIGIYENVAECDGFLPPHSFLPIRAYYSYKMH